MNHLQFSVPAGTLALTWNGRGLLTRIDWYDHPKGSRALSILQGEGLETSATAVTSSLSANWSIFGRNEIPPYLGDLKQKIRTYFDAGEPLGNVPWDVLDLTGCTDFQRRVYEAICAIPHGETRTYSWVAHRLRQYSASRAVGQALRRNPFPILIPCHRVVATQALGGFMGAIDPNEPEIQFKKCLLDIENRYLNPVFSFLSPFAENQASLGMAV